MSKNSFVVGHFVAAFVLLMLLTPALQAQTPNQLSPQNLTCSPAPCVFPNVQVTTGQYSTYSQVIAVNPNDSSQMLVSGEDFNCTTSYQGLSSTQDGGATWAHTCLPAQPNQSPGIGGPIVAYDLNNVAYAGGVQSRVSYLGGGGRMVLSSSRDNGLTWKIPITVFTSYVGISDPRIAVDNNPGSPFKNALYLSATTYSYYFNSQITVSHSGDGGKTWSTAVVDKLAFPLEQYYANLAIAADGTVYVTWARCKSRPFFSSCGGSVATLWISRSSDGGNTWSAPVQVAQTRLTPAGEQATWPWGVLPNTAYAPMSDIPVVAIDNSTGPLAGSLYVAYYNYSYSGKQMRVAVVASRDQGSTWSAPVRVSASNQGDEFFHWMSVAPDGTIGVTWLDRRNDPANVKYQPFYAISTDGGVSFSADQPLSTTLSDPFDKRFNGSEIGQYRTHVWAGNALYATWMDTRANTGYFQVELGGVQF